MQRDAAAPHRSGPPVRQSGAEQCARSHRWLRWQLRAGADAVHARPPGCDVFASLVDAAGSAGLHAHGAGRSPGADDQAQPGTAARSNVHDVGCDLQRWRIGPVGRGTVQDRLRNAHQFHHRAVFRDRYDDAARAANRKTHDRRAAGEGSQGQPLSSAICDTTSRLAVRHAPEEAQRAVRAHAQC